MENDRYIESYNFNNLIRDIRMMVRKKTTTLEEVNVNYRRDPFKVLIATVLSHRTKDEITSKAVSRLFSVYKDMKHLANGHEDEIRELIKPVGFYRIKAGKIKELSNILLERYNGKVPEDLDQLLSLPSVGRKTANCVLVYGFGKAAIPVDTHVHRIVNRLGIVITQTPEETEFELMRKLDKKYWIEINNLLVKFGKKICQPIKPRCNVCLLSRRCKWYKDNVLKTSPREMV